LQLRDLGSSSSPIISKHHPLLAFKLPPKLIFVSKFHPSVLQERTEAFKEVCD
jgi:hypothetical protein